ncbi:MAG: hypothetical protein WC712_14155 [Candidatus Brocadiia bacterium]
MKVHKGLAVFVLREKVLARELLALAESEEIRLVRLADDLMAADPEDGERMSEILKKKGYFPRPLPKASQIETNTKTKS